MIYRVDTCSFLSARVADQNTTQSFGCFHCGRTCHRRSCLFVSCNTIMASRSIPAPLPLLREYHCCTAVELRVLLGVTLSRQDSSQDCSQDGGLLRRDHRCVGCCLMQCVVAAVVVSVGLNLPGHLWRWLCGGVVLHRPVGEDLVCMRTQK